MQVVWEGMLDRRWAPEQLLKLQLAFIDLDLLKDVKRRIHIAYEITNLTKRRRSARGHTIIATTDRDRSLLLETPAGDPHPAPQSGAEPVEASRFRSGLSEAQLGLMNAILGTFPDEKSRVRHRDNQVVKEITRIPLEIFEKHHPIEGVRASEILDVAAEYLEIIERG